MKKTVKIKCTILLEVETTAFENGDIVDIMQTRLTKQFKESSNEDIKVAALQVDNITLPII